MKSIASIILATLCALSASGFQQRDVKVDNRADRVCLAGTLTVPDSRQPKAAIVLASGSGAQDRDESILGHRPFKVIAEGLADRGYAVLRMDDRGVGESTGSRESVTTQSNVRDVESALAWLDSAFADVPKGLVGHSEGGLVAVSIASRNPVCRFIVTLAGPAWRGDSIIMSQARALSTMATGRWEGEALQRRLLDISMSDMPVYLAKPMAYGELSLQLGDMARMPQVQRQLSAQVDAILSPWYREFLRTDPAEAIKAVDVPWLALNGSKDMQVLVDNLNTIKQLNPKTDTRALSGLNHLFQKATTGSPAEYATIQDDFSPEVVAMIADWLDGVL